MPDLSPSEVDGYIACPRRHYYERFLGLAQKTESLELGTRIHDLVEKILKGSPTPQGETDLHEYRCAMALADATPRPKYGIFQVEQWIDLASVGLSKKGKVDVMYRNEDYGVIIDHKTTQSWHYMPESIADNAQAILYAAWMGLPRVVCRWQYVNVKLKTPAVKVVSHEFTQQEYTEKFEALRPYLEEGKGLNETFLPVSAIRRDGIMKAMEGVCQAYGGCAFAKACQQDLIPATMLVRVREEEESGKMVWKKKEQNVVVPEKKQGIYDKAKAVLGSTDPINPSPESAPLTARTVVLQAPEYETLVESDKQVKVEAKKRGRPKKQTTPETVASDQGAPIYPENPEELDAPVPKTPTQPPGILLVGCVSLNSAFIQADVALDGVFSQFLGKDARTTDYGKGLAALRAAFTEELKKTPGQTIHVDRFAYYRTELVAAARELGYAIIQAVV